MDLSKGSFRTFANSVNPDQTPQNHITVNLQFRIFFLQTYIKQNWHLIDISGSAEHLQTV